MLNATQQREMILDTKPFLLALALGPDAGHFERSPVGHFQYGRGFCFTGKGLEYGRTIWGEHNVSHQEHFVSHPELRDHRAAFPQAVARLDAALAIFHAADAEYRAVWDRRTVSARDLVGERPTHEEVKAVADAANTARATVEEAVREFFPAAFTDEPQDLLDFLAA